VGKPETSPTQPEWVVLSEPLDFPSGIPGFEDHRRFVFVNRADLKPFLWLRSLDNAEISFPVIDCNLLRKQVLPKIPDEFMPVIGERSCTEVACYLILRVDHELGIITANTKAPIIIGTHSKRGYQVILDQDDLRVDEPLLVLVSSSGEK
jgi:flagellar assembly factor FliW